MGIFIVIIIFSLPNISEGLRLPNNPESWEIVGFDPKDFLEWWRDDSEQQQGVSGKYEIMN